MMKCKKNLSPDAYEHRQKVRFFMFAVRYSSELDHCVRRKFFETCEDAEKWAEEFYQDCLNYPCSCDVHVYDVDDYPEDIEEDD